MYFSIIYLEIYVAVLPAYAGSSDLKSSMTQGVCPTPGCRGVGHIKGAKYTGHHRYGMTFVIVFVALSISDLRSSC